MVTDENPRGYRVFQLLANVEKYSQWTLLFVRRKQTSDMFTRSQGIRGRDVPTGFS